MSEQQRSVFGAVDQDEMIKRLGEAPDSDIDAMLPQASASNPAVLAGIEAFIDADQPASRSDDRRTPVSGTVSGHPARPTPLNFTTVEFRGRLIDDLAATRAFLLHGPAGVRRRS